MQNLKHNQNEIYKKQKELGAVACSQSSLKRRGCNLSHKTKEWTKSDAVLLHGPSQSSLMKSDVGAMNFLIKDDWRQFGWTAVFI